jgi:hypothetical protein
LIRLCGEAWNKPKLLPGTSGGWWLAGDKPPGKLWRAQFFFGRDGGVTSKASGVQCSLSLAPLRQPAAATSPYRGGISELSRRGMHWDALDEDISVARLIVEQEI